MPAKPKPPVPYYGYYKLDYKYPFSCTYQSRCPCRCTCTLYIFRALDIMYACVHVQCHKTTYTQCLSGLFILSVTRVRQVNYFDYIDNYLSVV